MSVSTETNDQVADMDALGMSDEDFENMDTSAFDEPDADEGTDDEGDSFDESLGDDQEAEEEDAEPEAEAAESSATEDDEDDVTTDDDDAVEEGEGEDDESDTAEPDTEESGSEEADKEEASVDYKSEYEKLMTPFKANGKEMKVGNIDEARQLMQMGANYNKKMAGLKPSLKTLKLLENNELLDEGKLSYLIDLHKGDKGAIQKLIKDNGIDPMEMDVDAESDYKPESYTVDDREMELDDVLERIQDTTSYSDTINLVSNKWDAASKQHVANNPTALETINTHMASGVYELVNAEVEKQRTFGRLNGLSDIEAYHQVGYTMHEEGKLDALMKPDAAPAKKVVQPPKAKVDPAVKQKKRAASSTRTKPGASAPDDYNPLSMSDEEFEQSYNSSHR